MVNDIGNLVYNPVPPKSPDNPVPPSLSEPYPPLPPLPVMLESAGSESHTVLPTGNEPTSNAGTMLLVETKFVAAATVIEKIAGEVTPK